jgi:hypothetical protein
MLTIPIIPQVRAPPAQRGARVSIMILPQRILDAHKNGF